MTHHHHHVPPGTQVVLRARDTEELVRATIVRWIPHPHALWCEVELRFDPPFGRYGNPSAPWHQRPFRRLSHAALEAALVRVVAA